MMKTMIVVRYVSFHVGQVTFDASRRTSAKNWNGSVAPYRRRARVL